MPAYIPTQYTDSCANSFIFCVPMLLICSCFIACYCNVLGITICQPLTITPSITAVSSLNVKHVLMSCGNWSLLSDHFCMLYSLSHWRCLSWYVASFSSSTVIHYGTFVVNCMALMLIYMPLISSSLFSL